MGINKLDKRKRIKITDKQGHGEPESKLVSAEELKSKDNKNG